MIDRYIQMSLDPRVVLDAVLLIKMGRGDDSGLDRNYIGLLFQLTGLRNVVSPDVRRVGIVGYCR